MIEQEVIVREVLPEDAASLAATLKQLTKETDFITRDEDSPHMSAQEMSIFIEQKAHSFNEICLVAKIADKVVGVLMISAYSHNRIKHIGDIFLAVLKDYWGYGIGQLLMEAALDWAEHSAVIRKLELTVQQRNAKAVHIYEKFGFEIEGIKKRGAKTKDGEFLDVYLMGKLID